MDRDINYFRLNKVSVSAQPYGLCTPWSNTRDTVYFSGVWESVWCKMVSQNRY